LCELLLAFSDFLTRHIHATQERSRSLAELGEAKGRAEADIKILQVQVEAMEKENANLKCKVHALNKELEIRNGEREYERKAADIAAKQHLESVKKIAQLEEECNRLRLLIRKKLPGPAALQRMRNEVEGLGKPGALENKGRRSFGRSASHLDPVSMGMMKENAHDPGYNSTNGIAERMAAMDEEMKMLREALACRNEELQNAHIRCVKTANRLSLVEEELDKARGVQSQSKQQEIKALIKESPHSTDEISQDASSDTWASSLAATFDQFKKEKSKPQSNGNIDNRQASLRFELMDDFVEMEQLAKMSEPAKSDNTYSDTASFDGPRESPMTTASDQIQELEVELASTRRELESANNTICDLNAELAKAKELHTAFQSRNSANEVMLIKLQNQLDQLNKIQSNKERGGDGPSALSDQISGFLIKNSLATGRRESGKTGSALETSSSEGEAPGEYASVSDAESKVSPNLFIL
jgi:chromosome segregation ATPase